MSTVTLLQAQAAAGGRLTVSVVSRRENVYDAASEKVGTPANPSPVGTGAGEAQTTVRTWVLTSTDVGKLSVEVPELVADTDPAVLARITAAAGTLRAQAALPMLAVAAVVDGGAL